MFVLLISPGQATAALADLARAGEWQRVLEVASRRGEQLPLNPDEALIAAEAARALGDREAEERFLGIAVLGAGPELAALTTVQLAAVLEPADPERAVDLALSRFERGSPIRVREAAADVVTAVVASRRDGEQRARIEAAAGTLPQVLERRLELALAETDSENRAQRLERLLRAATGDLSALAAAESLVQLDSLSPTARWRVASTFFRHGLYRRAEPLLEGLQGVRDQAVPGDEVAFLRGRCAFRLGRWSEAIAWYRQALALARSAARRAELEVHIGRSHELSGDLEAAVEAAVRAVRLDTTDERRLFLARLRLRRGEIALAAQGLGRLRSGAARSRGEVMLAMAAMRQGNEASARAHLGRVRRAPWSAPAAVLEAQLAAAAGEAAAAIGILDQGWRELGPFWGERARKLMAQLPEEDVRQWRNDRVRAVHGAGAKAGAMWRELARWAVLEPGREQRGEIRRRVEAAFAARFEAVPPQFPAGLAADLWRLGLEREAARWDPAGFPQADAGASAWSAGRFLELGLPWRAIRTADGAWRQVGSEMPSWALPALLRRALLPLPDPAVVRQAAAAGEVDWGLLAAVAREESRWDPRALSSVGARGLVQLMPATAVSVTERIGAAPPTADDLFDPGTSLGLGAAELGRLLKLFGGRRAPAVAAYNAGEVQAGIWLDQCGTGCSDALYVANISFAATRVYTAAVLAAADAYVDFGMPAAAPLSD